MISHSDFNPPKIIGELLAVIHLLGKSHNETALALFRKIESIFQTLVKIDAGIIKENASELIDHQRTILEKIMRNQKYDAEISPELRTLLYNILIHFAEIIPRNNKKKSHTEYNFLSKNYNWICPISFKESYECSSTVALTTGYLYNKKTLLKHFRTSLQFIDPVTRTQLPEFDIKRIITLEAGLQKIKDLENIFNREKQTLLSRQARCLSHPDNYIRERFLVCISRNKHRSERETARYQLRGLIERASIAQLPPKSKKSNQLTNFSNLDLSYLCFSRGHHLVDPISGGELDLRGANLSHCVFLGDSTGECIHADLTGANLEHARFLNLPGNGICIKTTNFTNANLRNADLTGIVNWGEVNLAGTDLTGAFLYNRDGIKITGEHLKELLKANRCINTDFAIFENTPRREVTFAEFKQAYDHEFHSKWLKNPFSTMKWGLMFGAYKSMTDVNTYVEHHPNTRSAQVLNSLRRR